MSESVIVLALTLWGIFSYRTSQKKVSLNTFLDTLMSDPPPQCLVWLPLMHRLANVENGKTPRGIFINVKASRAGRM